MAEAYSKDDMDRRMNGAVATLKSELGGLRTGRASAALLDPVKVEAYGNVVPINQVGTVSTPEARMITVQVWDKGLAKAVDKAIRDAGLGLNPQMDGQLLRIPLPELNQERRKELTKLASKYAEAARVAVRNVRRDGMELLKKLEKDKKIGEDEQHTKGDELQKLTDAHIKDIDAALHGFATSVGGEIAGSAALDEGIERGIALVAPHDAVDVVIADLVLDHREDPVAVIRVTGRGIAAEAAEDVDFHGLGEIGNVDGIGRAVAGIFEEWLHQLDEDLHAALVGGRAAA